MKRKRGEMRMKRGIGKRISKSAMSLVLVCIMLFGVVDVTAYAAEVVDSGNCGAYGDNVIWELDSDGKLTISGTGEMYIEGYPSPWYEKRQAIVSVEIGNGVTYIDNGAFHGCSSLTSISIPDSVTKIGSAAFDGCSSLTSISIPDSVTEIGSAAFQGCSSLTSISIPSGVTVIEDGTFIRCSSLTEIMIPSGVTGIGWMAFEGCSSLTHISIPSGVTEISSGAFYDCSSLTSIDVAENNASYKSVDGILFNKNGTELIAYPAGKTSTSYAIPSGVTRISEYAFSYCSNLTSISIPSGVTEIGSEAFIECDSLTNIGIPSSVTEIGDAAFSVCISLTNIEIPSSVTEIGSEAFIECDSLTSIIIPPSVTKIGAHACGYGYDMPYSQGEGVEYESVGYKKYKGFTIVGDPGSAAETYANENGFTFIDIKTWNTNDSENTDDTEQSDPTSSNAQNMAQTTDNTQNASQTTTNTQTTSSTKQIGWVQEGDTWHYNDANGVAQTGWVNDGAPGTTPAEVARCRLGGSMSAEHGTI